MARVGLLGGTFNPPHLAHLVCAQEALVQLGLDRVLLVPAATPRTSRSRTTRARAPGGHVRRGRGGRCAARRLARRRRPAGRAYSVDTLRALTGEAPGDELTFIVGGDMAEPAPWREPEAILALAELGVAEREGAQRADIERSLAGLAGAAERVRFFDVPRIDISSSLLRRRAAAGLPLRYWVPDAVADYVERDGLYGGTPQRRLSLGAE